jgi:DNA ligase-4
VIDDTFVGDYIRYATFCDFGSGYRMEQLEQISKDLEQKGSRYDPKNVPEWFLDSILHDKPDFIIHPKGCFILKIDSQVIQIRASEIVPSDKYGAKMTLRFPRFIDFRPNKPISDAMTLSEAQNKFETNNGKMLNPFKSSIDEPATRKRKINPIRKAQVKSILKMQDLSAIQNNSSLFDNHQFCIFTDIHAPNSKKSLEELIASHLNDRRGGIVQNTPRDIPKDKVFYVIADSEKGSKVKNTIKGNRFNIIKSQYICDCIAQNQVRI